MVAGDIGEAVDCLVIGGGPGGYVAAISAARMGRTVTLIEAATLGGVCLNVGCIPSKALIRLAQQRAELMAAADSGLHASPVVVDLAEFQTWKDGVVSGLVAGIDGLLSAAGVTVIRGVARFVYGTRVAIQTSEDAVQYADFRDVVIATGSVPLELPGLPFDQSTIVDSTAALGWDRLPERLLVIGGGSIGLELGLAFAQLGAHVSIVEAQDRLLPGFDPDLSRAAAAGARAAGAQVMLGSTVTGYDGREACVTAAGGEVRVVASVIVVAVGRRPRLFDLNGSVLGLDNSNKLLAVDPTMRLSRHVFAIGDITRGPALAHRASAQGRVLGSILGGVNTRFDAAVVPEVVFATPEIASVGMTKDQAISEGIRAGAARFPLQALGRALIDRAGDGWLKVVYVEDTGQIVGVQMCGPHAAEVIGEAALAIEMAATLEDVALVVHPHPGFGEAFAEACELALGKPIHVRLARKRQVT